MRFMSIKGAIPPEEQVLSDLMTKLDSIDEEAPLAELNKTTIPDNHGNRIELNEGEDSPDNT
jgi:hypothetical protein